jgi:hypothetical protein
MTSREKTISQQAYVQREMRVARRSENSGATVSTARVFAELGRYVSDFGRQALLFAGLLLLLAIIAAATTGNRAFAEFIAWTGWFN